MQVRAICVQIAYHSKLGVSSLSGDSKNAHHSPADKQVLHLLRWFTHTHFCAEWFLRIVKWNISYVQKGFIHLKMENVLAKGILMLVKTEAEAAEAEVAQTI